MSKINVIRGLLKNRCYIKQLENEISQTYIEQNTESIISMIELEQYENNFLENITSRMDDVKDYKLTPMQEKIAYYDAMQGNSRRIRPTFVQMGNMCSRGHTNKEDLIHSGLSIEMIHKMSLILDDYFDQDLTRKGNPTFHTKYDQRTMIDTSNLLLRLSNSIFYNSVQDLKNQQHLLKLYKETIINMGNGFIEDLDRTDRKIEQKDAIRINDMQSSIILKNSFLIGYLLGSESQIDDVYDNLSNIGLNIGAVFQGFNDIENFLNEESQNNNKGNLYSDLKANRKNIILSLVPRELFYSPYTDQDIIRYIKDNKLIEETSENLTNRMESVNMSIMQLPNGIARDTLLFASNHITEKTLKKINNCR